MTTRPDHDSVAQPPPTRIPQWAQIIAGGLVLAALIALGWWWAAGSSTTPPAGPTLAGSAVCQRQVVVNFRSDADLHAHEQELRTHPRVTAVTLETREQVLEWYRALFARAGHPELGRLMRIEAMPARAWLAAAKDNLDPVRAELRTQLGSTAEDVWVTNPCLDDRLAGSSTRSPVAASR